MTSGVWDYTDIFARRILQPRALFFFLNTRCVAHYHYHFTRVYVGPLPRCHTETYFTVVM